MSESEFLTIGEIVKASLSRTKKYVDAVLQAKKVSWEDVENKPKVATYKGRYNFVPSGPQGGNVIIYVEPKREFRIYDNSGDRYTTFPTVFMLADYLLKNDLKWTSIPDIPTDLVYDADLTWGNLTGKPTNLVTSDQLTWDSIQDKPTEFPPSEIDWSKITGKPSDIVIYKGSLPESNQIPSDAEAGWLYYDPNNYVFKLVVGKLSNQVLTLTIPSNESILQNFVKKESLTWDNVTGKPENLVTSDQLTWNNVTGKPEDLVTSDQLTWENIQNKPSIEPGGPSDVSWEDIKNKPDLIHYNGTVSTSSSMTDFSLGSLYYVTDIASFAMITSVNSDTYVITKIPSIASIENEYLKIANLTWDNVTGKPENLATTDDISWGQLEDKPETLIKYVGNIVSYYPQDMELTGYTTNFEDGRVYQISPQRTDEASGNELWEICVFPYPDESPSVAFKLDDNTKNYIDFSFGTESIPMTGIVIQANVDPDFTFTMHLYIKVTEENIDLFPSYANATLGEWQVLNSWILTDENMYLPIALVDYNDSNGNYISQPGYIGRFLGNDFRVRFESSVEGATLRIEHIMLLRPSFIEYPNHVTTKYTPSINDAFHNFDNDAFYVVQDALNAKAIGQFPVQWSNVTYFPEFFTYYGEVSSVSKLPVKPPILHKGCAVVAYVTETKTFMYYPKDGTGWRVFAGSSNISWNDIPDKPGDLMTRDSLLESEFLQAVPLMDEYSDLWSLIPDEANSSIGTVDKKLFNPFGGWDYTWESPADSASYNWIEVRYDQPVTIKGFTIYSNGAPISELPSAQLTFHYSDDGETWSLVYDSETEYGTNIVRVFNNPVTAKYFRFASMKSNQTDYNNVFIAKISFLTKHAFRPCDVYFDFDAQEGYFYTGPAEKWKKLYGPSTPSGSSNQNSPILFPGTVNNANVVDGSEYSDHFVSLSANANTDTITNIIDGNGSTSWTNGDAPSSSGTITLKLGASFPTFDVIRIKTPSENPIITASVYAGLTGSTNLQELPVTIQYDAHLGLTDIMFTNPFILNGAERTLELRNLTSSLNSEAPSNSVTIHEIYFRPSNSEIPKNGDLRINETPFTNDPDSSYGEFYYSSKWRKFGNVFYGGSEGGRGSISYNFTEKQFSFGVNPTKQVSIPTTELMMSKINDAISPLIPLSLWSPEAESANPSADKPWQIGAQSTDDVNHPAWKAFDGNASTYWEGPSGGVNLTFSNVRGMASLENIVGVRLLISSEHAEYFPFGSLTVTMNSSGTGYVDKEYSNLTNPGTGYIDVYFDEMYGNNVTMLQLAGLEASDSTKPVRLTQVLFIRKTGDSIVSILDIDARIDQKIQDTIGDAIAGAY